MGLLQHMTCMEEEEEEAEEVLEEAEEVGHKIPMVTGSEDEEHVEVLRCLSVLLKVTECC